MNKETYKKNRLIATFMYIELHTDDISWFDKNFKPVKKYNESWDALIPVIDKITSDWSYIKYKDHTSSMIDDGGIYINTKYIENTYDDVVDFIKWYNTF